nr:myosin heavy chain IB-like [Aegilops tauschii subsp. strangulata]
MAPTGRRTRRTAVRFGVGRRWRGGAGQSSDRRGGASGWRRGRGGPASGGAPRGDVGLRPPRVSGARRGSVDLRAARDGDGPSGATRQARRGAPLRERGREREDEGGGWRGPGDGAGGDGRGGAQIERGEEGDVRERGDPERSGVVGGDGVERVRVSGVGGIRRPSRAWWAGRCGG